MKRGATSKLRITVTIMPFVNEMLEKASKKAGVSKSRLVEEAIKNFLGEQLEKDAKKLAELQFDDLPSEDEWLELQSDIRI